MLDPFQQVAIACLVRRPASSSPAFPPNGSSTTRDLGISNVLRALCPWHLILLGAGRYMRTHGKGSCLHGMRQRRMLPSRRCEKGGWM